jgi:hypothetical protein
LVFLVGRKGPELRLTGRSIFEEVEVPNYIPEPVRKFYSQALIAFKSNQTLPGLFMLRTVIEQHMRSETGQEDVQDSEKLYEIYARKLPEAFKQTFPSLFEIYAKLSAALHRADVNDALFHSEIKRIELHFRGISAFYEAAKLQPPQADKRPEG